jgi:hypothetical protein
LARGHEVTAVVQNLAGSNNLPAGAKVLTGDASLQLREYVLRRFPYCVVYDIHNDELAIVAIAHQSRREQYWQNRVQEEPAVYHLAA